jgi:hypothetical protein
MAANSDYFLKSKSGKILNTVRKELKKYSPMGASQRRFFVRNDIPKAKNDLLLKMKYNYDDRKKFINYAVYDYLNKNPEVKDIHRRSPFTIETRRRSTLSPPNLPLSPRPIEQVARQTPRFYENDQAIDIETISPKIEAIHEIIDACEAASSPKEVRVLPKVLKSYTKKITKLVDGIDKYISKSRQSPKERVFENPTEEKLNKELEERLVNEFYTKEGVREMVETEFADKKIKRKIWTQREYSVPKNIEMILRKHTKV